MGTEHLSFGNCVQAEVVAQCARSAAASLSYLRVSVSTPWRDHTDTKRFQEERERERR